MSCLGEFAVVLICLSYKVLFQQVEVDSVFLAHKISFMQ